MTIFIWWEYSGTPEIWTLWQFSFWGVYLGHLGFGLSDNFHFGGYSGTPWIWTLWQFSFGGEYSGTPQIWTPWQFSFWGGILGHLGFGLYDNFHLGVFWDTSDLDSMTIFIWGEYLGTPWIWTLWQFSFLGGILEHLGFGLSDNIHLGVFWDTSDLDSMTIFIWGEYLGTPWIWTLWQFSFGGQYSGTFGFWTPWQFLFWGVFWNTSDLDSMTIFILGGYLGTPWIWTLWQFSFWGGILEHLRFGLSDNFHLGVFWDTSDLDSLTNFIWGEYLGTPWIWTLWQFSFGGYSGTPWFLDSLTIFILGGILGHLGFGLYDNFHLGGLFWDTSDLDSMTIFILGILGHLRFGLYDNFQLGGSILWHLAFGFYDNFHLGGNIPRDTLDLDSLTIFILGVFWNASDLDSMTIFIWASILWHIRFGTLWQFSFWGGILGHLRFGLYDNFHFEGVFWDTSDLDSLTIFIWGFSGTPQIWTVWQFSFRGSI